MTNERELLEEVTTALGDLSFECFGVFGTTAPTVATYNRTFGVLEKARAALASQVVQEPVAHLWLGTTDKTPPQMLLPLPAMYDLPKGKHLLYAAPVAAGEPHTEGVQGLDAVTADAERLCWALRPLVRMIPAGDKLCWVRFKVGSQEFTIGNQPLAEDEAAQFAGLFVFALAGAFRTLPAGVPGTPANQENNDA